MKIVKTAFFLLMLFSWNEVLHAQRTSAVIKLNSVNHATCYGVAGNASINLALVGFQAGTVIGGYTLVLEKDGVYYTTLTSVTLQSSASMNLSLTGLHYGDYNITGTITAYNSTNSTGIGAFSTQLLFSVGYQVVWDEIREMAIQSNPSTILQNVTTPSQTYAGARTLNNTPGDFWFHITPTFNSGNTTSRSIFVPLFYTGALGTFNPASTHYLEFRKDPTSVDGIYYKSPTGTFKLDGVTSSSKIRVFRNAGTITVYSESGIFPLTYGGTTNFFSTTSSLTSALSVHTKVIGDGVTISTDVKCGSANDAYATLFYELDGYYYTVKNGKLRFIFNQNYDTQNNLKFTIYSNMGTVWKTQANFPAVQATYGDNYLTLDLTTTSGCLGQGMFVLEVVSDKKEKMFLRFYNEYSGCLPEMEGNPGGIGGF